MPHLYGGTHAHLRWKNSGNSKGPVCEPIFICTAYRAPSVSSAARLSTTKRTYQGLTLSSSSSTATTLPTLPGSTANSSENSGRIMRENVLIGPVQATYIPTLSCTSINLAASRTLTIYRYSTTTRATHQIRPSIQLGSRTLVTISTLERSRTETGRTLHEGRQVLVAGSRQAEKG